MGGGNDKLRPCSDTAFGTGPIQLLNTFESYSHILIWDNLALANDLRTGPSGRIKTGSYTLTKTGALRPGATGLGATPDEAIATFTVDGKLNFGTDNKGCDYYWDYDGENGDLINCLSTLTFGKTTHTLHLNWLGDGDPVTGDYPIIKYSGADPDMSSVTWEVVPYKSVSGTVYLDTNTKELRMKIGEMGTVIILK